MCMLYIYIARSILKPSLCLVYSVPWSIDGVCYVYPEDSDSKTKMVHLKVDKDATKDFSNAHMPSDGV